MSRQTILVTLLAVLGLFAVISVPITLATLTAPTTNGQSTFSSTAIYPPTALTGSWTGYATTLSWTAPAGGGNGNGFLISGLNNGASSSCPTTAASYTTTVGSTSGTSFTDSSSTLLASPTWTYNCYLVQTGYNPSGAAPWGSTPPWTNASGLAIVAVQMAITHLQNHCVSTSTATATSLTNTLASAVTAGALLTAVTNGKAPQSISDNVNGTWTQAITSGSVSLWYKPNSAAAAAGALTITLTAARSALAICADEFSRIATTNPLDQSSAGTAAASPWVAPATAAVPAAELVMAGVATGTSGAILAAGTSNGVAMTLGGYVTNAQGAGGSEYLLSAAAGPQDSSMTINPAASGSTGVQGVFKPK